MSGVRNAAVNTAALAISSGLNFVALFLWVRLLDPHAFGTYSLVSATALLLNALLFEWLRVVGARTLYDSGAPLLINPARADSIFSVSLAVTGGFLLVAGALWIAKVPLLGVDPAWLPLIVGFVLSEMALAILAMVSRVRMLPWQFFSAMVLRSALSIALGLVLVAEFDIGALGVLLGTVCAQLLTAALLMARDPLWRGLRAGPRSRADRAGMREVLTLGYPLIASAALSYGVGVADRYLVNFALGTAQVGYYAAPVDILQKTLGFIMLAINITAYPALVRAYEDKGSEAAARLLERNFALQLGLGLPAAVAFTMLAPGIASLLLGATYKDVGATLLPWVAFAALLRLLVSLHLAMVFQLVRRMTLMLVAPAVTLAVLVPAGLYGMRGFGLVGMAVAALAAQMVAYAVCAAFAKRALRFRLVTPDAAKIVLACAVMAAALYPFGSATHPLTVIGACALGGGLYLATLAALRLEAARPLTSRATALLRRRRA